MDSAVQSQDSQNTNNSSNTQISNNENHSNNATTVQPPTIQNSSQLSDVDQTAMCEYLELVQSEYSIERGKKDSFENRAGIIMALVGALLVFMLDKIPFNDVLTLCKKPLTFVVLLKIIFGFASYITLVVALFFSFLTIATRKQENYPVETINLSYLAESRKDAIARITLKYRDIITSHREYNEKRAHKFKLSLILSVISICSFIVYLIIK